jgi:large subunit ribosomal protein L10
MRVFASTERGKDFYFLKKGGELALAISREKKKELVDQYVDWIDNSKALVMTEYSGLTMKQIDELRKKVRSAGGEFHVVKNTLSKVAFERVKLEPPTGYLEGSTAIAFAFEDAPALAKAITEFAKESDFVKIKGGYLGTNHIDAEAIKALADLPPLPVMRGQLLGTIMAPANKLARVLAEPARQVAAVLQAYADKDTEPAAA